MIVSVMCKLVMCKLVSVRLGQNDICSRPWAADCANSAMRRLMLNWFPWALSDNAPCGKYLQHSDAESMQKGRSSQNAYHYMPVSPEHLKQRIWKLVPELAQAQEQATSGARQLH